MTLMMTEEEEDAAGKEDNDEWQDMADDEADALIKEGEAAVAKYMKFKKEKKKSKSDINKTSKKTDKTGKDKETEPPKKKKHDPIEHFKLSHRTFLPVKQYLKWLQNTEHDTNILVKFKHPTKGTFIYKYLTMVGPEGDEKKPKFQVYKPSPEEEEGYEEGVDYL